MQPHNDDNQHPIEDVLISASIMCADSLSLADQIRQMEKAGVDLIHFDVMDAHFVPNMPIGLKLLADIAAFSSLPLDVHLMVDDNEFFEDHMADRRVSRISIHLESAEHLDRQLFRIRDLDILAGVALNPATPLSSLDYVLDRVDFLVIMTVNPGFAGQTMVPSAIRKIRDPRRYLDEHRCHIPIQVDGNVSFENIPQMVAAGADILVGGSSSVFRAGHAIAENTELVREAAASGLAMRRQCRNGVCTGDTFK